MCIAALYSKSWKSYFPSCISGSHRAHASCRVMSIAMAIGQAAGTMAAVSVQGNPPVSELEAAAVQAKLREQGCRITDA